MLQPSGILFSEHVTEGICYRFWSVIDRTCGCIQCARLSGIVLEVRGVDSELIKESRVEKTLCAGVALGSHNPKHFLGE